MLQRWERLTFIHWPYDPAAVQRLLPDGLEVDAFDGAAWVGLVPFFMRVSTGRGRSAPWVSHFCETNVRTYVRDRQGRAGVWFLSLDAARLGAVCVARATYRLPYFWSSMRLSARGPERIYRCRRRWPGPRGAASMARVRIGEPYRDEEYTERDNFLTARWVLFSAAGSGRRLARASHPPWPLRRAVVQELDDQLVAAAGLPPPAGEPLAHYSPGVDVRISLPERSA